MTDSPEQPSDEELSELIDDEENTVDKDSDQGEGGVEVGIPPAVEEEGDVDASEQKFSMDDFDSADVVENPIEEKIILMKRPKRLLLRKKANRLRKSSPMKHLSKKKRMCLKQMVRWRSCRVQKTLSNLSRQLEIDVSFFFTNP